MTLQISSCDRLTGRKNLFDLELFKTKLTSVPLLTKLISLIKNFTLKKEIQQSFYWVCIVLRN